MMLYGHRGAKGEAPENTLAGFLYARRIGGDALELDVRLSADDQLVVIHDETVDRTTNASGRVASFTAAELSKLDARDGFPDWPEPVGVPTLAEVFEIVADARALFVEVKHDARDRLERLCTKLIQLIEHHGIADRVTITSFDPVALEIMRRLAPEVPRAYIGAYDNHSYLDTAIQLGCRQAHIPLKTGSAAMVREAHSRGLYVSGWVANTPEEIATLVTWGVDAIVTDFPSTAMPILARRGGKPD